MEDQPNSEARQEEISGVFFYVDRRRDSDTSARLQYQLTRLIKRLDKFEAALGIKVLRDDRILADILITYSRDIDKMIKIDRLEPDQYKQAGHLGFWIRRLRPILSYSKTEVDISSMDDLAYKKLKSFANEIFALYLAHATILAAGGADDFIDDPEPYSREVVLKNDRLLHDMRYRSMTPYSFGNYLYMIFNKGAYPPR